jgi:hypothetical protein
MVFRRKKILGRWFDSIGKIFFFLTDDRYYRYYKILTDGSIVSVSIHRDYAQLNVTTVKGTVSKDLLQQNC